MHQFQDEPPIADVNPRGNYVIVSPFYYVSHISYSLWNQKAKHFQFWFLIYLVAELWTRMMIIWFKVNLSFLVIFLIFRSVVQIINKLFAYLETPSVTLILNLVLLLKIMMKKITMSILKIMVILFIILKATTKLKLTDLLVILPNQLKNVLRMISTRRSRHT